MGTRSYSAPRQRQAPPDPWQAGIALAEEIPLHQLEIAALALSDPRGFAAAADAFNLRSFEFADAPDLWTICEAARAIGSRDPTNILPLADCRCYAIRCARLMLLKAGYGDDRTPAPEDVTDLEAHGAPWSLESIASLCAYGVVTLYRPLPHKEIPGPLADLRKLLAAQAKSRALFDRARRLRTAAEREIAEVAA